MPSLRPRTIYNYIIGTSNQISLITLYSALILSTSIFIYITIYYTYVPVVQHIRPVYLQFETTCRENCSNPFAVVNFNDVRSSFYLSRGQSYRFVMSLEMPESEVNWKQGMFMIRLRLIESKGKTLYDITRPAILKNEMQTMDVQLIDNYIEGARFYFNKMDRAIVEILAKDIQIYSAHLHVFANLSGISYYMYSYPITSAVMGVFTLASFMTILSVYKGHSSSSSGMYELVETNDSEDELEGDLEKVQ